ncbi:MAG: glycerol-3-phosphate 1-O-acyltransferase PlsY [Dialister sp.]|nr:glycerol-3-phosphate 1-O-acyltransferase PlsY [Dialister sp.]
MTGYLWQIGLAYLIGALPFGFIIGKLFYRVDLRTRGSENIGATNAYRELGAVAGLATFALDFLKGFMAVQLGMPEPLAVLACALAAVIGNDWSVFLGFKSGKGVACSVGAFTFISPMATLAAFVVWLILMGWKKIVSLASIVAAPVVPLVIFFSDAPLEYAVFAAFAAVIVIGKHKDNIGRLLRGEEKPISRERR